MSSSSPALLYLDLLKNTLCFNLWPEPPIPIETLQAFKHRRSFISQARLSLLSLFSKILKKRGYRVTWCPEFSAEERGEGKVWPGYADTMIGMKRLDNLQYCIETVLQERIPGDLIETGVWRGGACVFMRAALAAYGDLHRRVFVADSFEGLPKPEADKWPADKGDTHYTHDFLAVSQEEVENTFRKYGHLDENVVFLKGWFKDTLPAAPIDQLAVMRLDGDMYGSTMEALRNLYPKLSTGGFCIIDDYGAVPACRQAVEDFRSRHMINSDLKAIDWTGAYWRKE